MENLEKYGELIEKTNPNFVEIKHICVLDLLVKD